MRKFSAVMESLSFFFLENEIQLIYNVSDIQQMVQIYIYISYIYFQIYIYIRASLVAQTAKNLPAMRETRVCSLGQEDPLEKEMATRSSILAWKIPWAEEPGELQPMVLQRVT